MYITPSFTRQGSQVRTLYHPPVISQLNQALTRNRSAFFTSKSSINTPYYYSYISTLVLLGSGAHGRRDLMGCSAATAFAYQRPYIFLSLDSGCGRNLTYSCRTSSFGKSSTSTAFGYRGRLLIEKRFRSQPTKCICGLWASA